MYEISGAFSLIKVVKVPGDLSGVGIKSRAWMSSGYTKVKLYPYVLSKSSDKKLNEKIDDLDKSEISIKVLSDGKRVSFLLKWRDESESYEDIEKFSDAVSLSFVEKNEQYPYLHSGDKKRGLLELYQRAVLEYEPLGDYSRQLLNFGSKKDELLDDEPKKYNRIYLKNGIYREVKSGVDFGTELSYKNGFWYAVFSKELNGKNINLNRAFVPFYISVWDGDKFQRGNFKKVSQWLGLRFVENETDDKLNKIQEESVAGNSENGRKLFEENCVICHNYRDYKNAPTFMAPNLSYIGQYALKDYIKESILEPSKVIIQSFNPKSHPNYPWFEVNEKGERVSTMPSFEWMDEKSIDDILAFLETL